MSDDYRYCIVLLTPEGESLGQVPASVDWEPAKECAALHALRKGGQDSVAVTSSASVRPRWHPKLGEPFMEGFRVTVGANGSTAPPVDFTNAYFKKQAEAASGQLVDTGVLAEGERFFYCVAAHPRERTGREGDASGFAVEEVPPAVDLKPGDLEEYLGASVPFKPGSEADLPVFVPRHVLSEITALSREAGAKETGGVLIGDIRRDSGGGDLFLVVSAQIPATHAQAQSTRLTFTAETWDAVHAAIRLRGTDEQMLGWFHSHPVREWCKNCPPEKRARCTRFEDYFSSDDKALHRTVFPRAWSVALLVSELSERHSSISMHGWRDGHVETRGFHVLEGRAEERER